MSRTDSQRAANIALARLCWEDRKKGRPVQVWNKETQEWERIYG